MKDGIAIAVLNRSSIRNINRLQELSKLADELWDVWEKDISGEFPDAAYDLLEFEAKCIYKVLNK